MMLIVIGIFSFLCGFVACALLHSTESAERERDIYFAYLDGVQEGRAARAEMVSVVDGEILS